MPTNAPPLVFRKEHMQEKERGTLLQVGLTTGQAIYALTKEPTEQDLDLVVIHSTSGDRIEIRRDYIVYVRASDVDLPTEDDIADYEAKLKSAPSGTNINVGSAAGAMQHLKQYGDGQYL